jgi:alpha-beta hydrolase superfamily lysophospholipase
MSGEHIELQMPDGFTITGLHWPVSSARGSVVIAHGINEHIGRYRYLADRLNAAGFTVLGFDHRGHGRSNANKSRSSNNPRFDQFVDDFLAAISLAHGQSDAPIVALGHSMGGLIAARAALRLGNQLPALVLSGPALKIPTDLNGWKLQASLAIARILPFLTSPAGVGSELSRDPAIRTSFDADELCIHTPVKLGIARQIYVLAEETRARASEITVPLLVMHGGADTITDPSGSEEFVRNAKSPDKEFVSWPGDYHEIFNELDKDQVLAHLTDWLVSRFPLPT